MRVWGLRRRVWGFGLGVGESRFKISLNFTHETLYMGCVTNKQSLLDGRIKPSALFGGRLQSLNPKQSQRTMRAIQTSLGKVLSHCTTVAAVKILYDLLL